MGMKLTPVIDLDKRRLLMTSSTLWRHHCVFYGPEDSNFTDRSVNYTPNDVTMLMTSQIIFSLARPTTGPSFKSIPLLEPKILKFCILAILVCKIHKSHVTQKMTPFLSINFQEVLLVKISAPYHVWFSKSQGGVVQPPPLVSGRKWI